MVPAEAAVCGASSRKHCVFGVCGRVLLLSSPSLRFQSAEIVLYNQEGDYETFLATFAKGRLNHGRLFSEPECFILDEIPELKSDKSHRVLKACDTFPWNEVMLISLTCWQELRHL